MDDHRQTISMDPSNVAIDRDAEVPIGVQLAWALRSRIRDGTFKAGQRLPALREMAEAIGVNVNTVKAVYQRLDRDGLIDSQQGSGTFVAAAWRAHSDVANIAAHAAREARETGVDPREVAAALYVSSASSSQSGDAAADGRRVLRRQIEVLERAIIEIESEHPGIAPAPTGGSRGTGPALQSAEELAQVRAQLIRRLTTVQGAIDELAGIDAKPRPRASKKHTPQPEEATSPKRAPRSPTAARPATA